jgi:hypothetical protein
LYPSAGPAIGQISTVGLVSIACMMSFHVSPANRRVISLLARGFPPPDETTGNYCLEAVDAWRLRRYPHLFPAPCIEEPKTDRDTARNRIANM